MTVNYIKRYSARYLLVSMAFTTLFIASCNSIKQKTKGAINKTGETIGKGTSEFFKGVSQGVDQTFECNVDISKSLTAKGLQPGKFKITKARDSINTILTVYLIFNKDFKETLTVKVFDMQGHEYGRSKNLVEGKSGEAGYNDFMFDKRTEIESKSIFTIE